MVFTNNFYPDNQNYPAYPVSPDVFKGDYENPEYPEYFEYPEYPVSPAYMGEPDCPADYYPTPYAPLPTAILPTAALPYSYSPIGGHYCNEELTRIIQECQAVCEYATTHVKSRRDFRLRRTQLILLRDCADICGLNAKFVPRCSTYDRQTVLICARICECCARECDKFSDRLSQHCAKICCHCAKACRAYAR